MHAQWIGTYVAVVIVICGVLHPERARADEILAEKSGCMECHAINREVNKQLSGPAFHDVAAKYRGNANARGALIQVLKKGGKGKWPGTGEPMPPYSPRLTDAEIQRLVDWVLRL